MLLTQNAVQLRCNGKSKSIPTLNQNLSPRWGLPPGSPDEYIKGVRKMNKAWDTKITHRMFCQEQKTDPRGGRASGLSLDAVSQHCHSRVPFKVKRDDGPLSFSQRSPHHFCQCAHHKTRNNWMLFIIALEWRSLKRSMLGLWFSLISQCSFVQR